MSKQLRDAIEKARSYYIQKLLEHGVYTSEDDRIHQLTLTELAMAYKRHIQNN